MKGLEAGGWGHSRASMRRSGLSAIRYPLMHRDVQMARNAWMRASGHPLLSYLLGGIASHTSHSTDVGDVLLRFQHRRYVGLLRVVGGDAIAPCAFALIQRRVGMRE